MKLQGQRSVDQYFTELSGLPHYPALDHDGMCGSFLFVPWPSLRYLDDLVFHIFFDSSSYFRVLHRIDPEHT